MVNTIRIIYNLKPDRANGIINYMYNGLFGIKLAQQLPELTYINVGYTAISQEMLKEIGSPPESERY